jgi:hypothetical protein
LAGEHCLELDPYAVLAASALNRKKWASPVAVAVVVEMTVIVKVPVLAVVLEMMAIVKVAVVVAVAEAALARKKWTSPEMEVDAMGIMMLVLAPLVETAALAQMQWRALQRTEEVGVMMAPAVESAAAGALARMQWASPAVVVEAAAACTLAREQWASPAAVEAKVDVAATAASGDPARKSSACPEAEVNEEAALKKVAGTMMFSATAQATVSLARPRHRRRRGRWAG